MQPIDQSISDNPVVILFVFLLAAFAIPYYMRDDWQYKAEQWIRKIINHNKIT